MKNVQFIEATRADDKKIFINVAEIRSMVWMAWRFVIELKTPIGMANPTKNSTAHIRYDYEKFYITQEVFDSIMK